MKKLKIKVFTIIFSILTIITLFLLFVSNYRTYQFRYNNIKDIINRPVIRKELNIRNIFLDSTVYTIILDDNGNYVELINNTENEVDEDYIKSIVNEIRNNKIINKYIGNLYFDKYSYSHNNNILTIVDNTLINKELIYNLVYSIIIFIILEIIIYFIVYFLTRWVTLPVEEGFIKQKRFIADASHELKTPLSVIMASCDAYNNDKNKKWIDNIKSESERMSKLVKDLLDLAKLENNVELVKENINLSNLIESSILTFESLFYDKNIRLKYDIKDNLMFNCNQDQIKELVGILIDNAIKYTNKKGKVFINLDSNNKDIILEFSNSGNPIKEEDLEKIFERFYKIDDSRNRNNNNYGLGLAIAKNIVSNHNGQISAYSNNGLNTFKVVFNSK